MAQTVKLKRTSVAGRNPTTSNIEIGELAFNSNDKSLFIRGDSSAIVTLHDESTLHINHTNNRVGVGTTSPSTALHMAAADGSAELILARTGAQASLWGLKPYNADFYIRENGTDRVTIKAGGRVGIGITSPDAPLHVEDSTSSAYGGLRVVGAGTGSGSTNVRQIADFGRTNSGSVSGVWLGGRTDETTAVIGAKTASGNIAFEVYQSGWQERMRITNAGNVGIGQTNPGQKLTVDGNIRADGHYYVGGVITTTSSRGFNAADGSAAAPTHTFHSDQGTGMYRIGANHLGFATGGSSRWSIDSSGGITQNGGSNYDYSGGGNFSIRHLAANQNITFATKNSSSVLAEKMRIRGDGNVGIGTSSPSNKLHVHHANAALGFDQAIRVSTNVNDYTAGRGGGILMQNADVNTAGVFGVRGGGWEGNLAFYTHTGTSGNTFGTTFTEKMRITDDGNVGIGTASPATKLDVVADGANGIVLNNDTGNAGVSGRLFFKDSTSTSALLNVGGDFEIRTGATVNSGSGTRRLVVKPSGVIRFNNAYSFPTADGSTNQVLKTDGSGNLTFATIAGASGGTSISDSDGDTKIQVEESSDEDKIRFDAAGVERFRIGSDVEIIGTSDFNITGASRRLNFTSGTGTIQTTTANSIALATNSTNRLTITGTGDATFANNLTVTGNLIVNGTQTTLNTATLDVEDKNITLNKGSGDTSGSADGAGITIQDAVNASTDATILWDATNDNFVFSHDLKIPSKIRHAGDVDNYFSFATTDTQSFVTGNSTRLQITNSLVRLNQENNNQDFAVYSANSDNMLYVDASTDRVGIGTASPDTTLHIASASPAITLEETDATTSFNKTEFQSSGNTLLFNTRQSNNTFVSTDYAIGKNANGATTHTWSVAGSARAVLDSSNFDIESGGFRVNDSGNNYPFAVNQHGFMTTRGSTITQLNATGDHGNVPLSVLADVASTRTASYVEIGDIGSAGNRFKINSSGSVGIGTASPQNTLHVNGTLRVGPYFASSDRDHFLVTPGGSLTTVSTPNENANYDNSAGNIHIRTNSGYNTPVERLTVTSAGNVGIGTTAPGRKLHLKDGQIKFQNTGSGGWAGLDFSIGNGTYDGYMGMLDSNGSFFIDVDSNGNDLVILQNGNVGIGTSTPAAKLHISGNSDVSDENCQLIIDDVDGSAGSRIPSIQFRSVTGGTTTNQGRIRATDTQGMVISGSAAQGDDLVVQAGGVGIGTTSPDYKLEVVGNTMIGDASAVTSPSFAARQNIVSSFQHGTNGIGRAGSLYLLNTNTNRESGFLTFGAYYNNTNNLYYHTGGIGGGKETAAGSGWGGYLSFWTTSDGTAGAASGQFEHMRITADGNVGIGTTSPAKPLHVQFSGDNGIRIESEDNHASLYVDSHTGYGQYIRFTEENNNKYWINSTGGNLVFRPAATGTAANQITFNASGAVGIGTATLTNKIHVNGNARIEGNLMAGDSAASNVPGRPIHIKSTGDNAALRIEDSTSSNLVYDIRSTHGTGLLFVDVTNGATRMTIGDDGTITTANNLAVSGNAVITGNLIVNGTSTTLNTATLDVEDKNITLNKGSGDTSSTADGAGITIQDAVNSSTDATILWNQSISGFKFSHDIRLDDELRLEFGDSSDLIIRHANNNRSYISGNDIEISTNSFRLFNLAGTTGMITATGSGVNLLQNTSVTGNLTASGTIGIDAYTVSDSSTTTSATTQTTIDTFTASAFRSCRYTIQVSNTTDSEYHSTELLLVHDGTTPGITEFGSIFTGAAAEATFDADISSGNVRLRATPASSDSMTFKVVRHAITA